MSDPDGPLRKVRQEGLRATLAIVPLTQTACAVAALALWLVFRDHLPAWAWAVWIVLAGATALVWIILARRDLARDRSGPWVWVRHLAVGALQGLNFMSLMISLFPGAGRLEAVFLGVFAASFLASGALVYPATPALALLWVGITSGAIGVVLVRDGSTLAWVLLGFLALFVGYMVLLVFRMAGWFRERTEAQVRGEDQAETIGLLLRDFEENAGDWLWETDVKGNLRHLSPQMERVFLGPGATAGEHNLSDLMRKSYRSSGLVEASAWADVRRRLDGVLPFQGVLLRLNTEGGTTWWELSGKPLFAKDGSHRGWRGVGKDVTARVVHQQETEHLARFDSLTGLANRYHLRKVMEPFFDGFREPGRGAALVLVDLDHLQNINAVLGHEAGDAVLKEVAGRLRLFCQRFGGTPARLGGDDFGVLIDGPDGTEVPTLAAELMGLLRASFEAHGDSLQIRFWAGYAVLDPRIGDADQWFRCADSALRAAKETGPNVVRAYDAAMAARFQRSLALVNDLGRALPRGEFQLNYQPLFDAVTGRVTGAEALCRWTHPRLGPLSPAEFIPLAEQSGHIVELGAWILGQACRDALAWPPEWKVSVNVSAGQLLNRRFEGEVFRVLDATGLSPGRLKLEITESTLVGDGRLVKETLEVWRRRGVAIALDDFGTGYSSLSYLRSFPLDELKIDQSFVRTLESDPQSFAIVETIIRLAKILRLTTTAEGVETEGQAQILRDIGCEVFQGYLFAKPLPQADLIHRFLTAF